MHRHIEFIEVLEIQGDGVIKKRPHMVSFDSIKSLVTSKHDGCCEVKFNNDDRMLVVGQYETLKTLLEECRTGLLPKLCYVFQQSAVGSTYSHYVPTDTVGSIMVNKGSNVVTLVLKTGEKISTGLVMTELKKTLIEVRF